MRKSNIIILIAILIDIPAIILAVDGNILFIIPMTIAAITGFIGAHYKFQEDEMEMLRT